LTEEKPGEKQEPDPLGLELTRDEKAEVQRRRALRADVVHEAIREEGEQELRRPSSALAWSGLAAGLSMGFSLLVEGLIRAHLPDRPWRPLFTELGYSIGYLIVILGRQQLFTENTLTVILPLLARRDTATLLQVLRLWAVVLASNLAGGLLFAWALDSATIFDAAARRALDEVGREAITGDAGSIFVRGIFAGWLIALLVWLLPFADTARVSVIILITYVVGLGNFTHIVAGSIEAFYSVMAGAASWSAYLTKYMLPTLIGNILGGVTLVAVINHAQVVAGGGDDV